MSPSRRRDRALLIPTAAGLQYTSHELFETITSLLAVARGGAPEAAPDNTGTHLACRTPA